MSDAINVDGVTYGQHMIRELRIDVANYAAICSKVNDAIGRAGIHCALDFWEAIDRIAAERDYARKERDAFSYDRLTAERDSLRSALAEAARTIDAQEGRIHHMTALLDEVRADHAATRGHLAGWQRVADERAGQLATALTERDEARSRLAKAREEIEAFATPVDLMRQRIERDTASAIAAWLDGEVAKYRAEWEAYAMTVHGTRAAAAHDAAGRIAADIRASAWRKP